MQCEQEKMRCRREIVLVLRVNQTSFACFVGSGLNSILHRKSYKDNKGKIDSNRLDGPVLLITSHVLESVYLFQFIRVLSSSSR